jgi:phospholipid/cholesterol/gamma-HCH transport system ATP-binding protein
VGSQGIFNERSSRHDFDGGRRSSPYFEFRHVSISFGNNQVLNDVSFSVMPGETVCLMGKSGVGKSVSLRILVGFLKPDAGRVIAAGSDITDFSEEQLQDLRKKVSMIFQSGALFDSLTVRDNVAFPLRERGELTEPEICQIVEDLLDMVGVRHVADKLPSEVATGMKRSVAIARALAAGPEAVLYDEPTTMVDPIMARRLANLIATVKSQLKLTSVVVTHDTWLAEKVADRVIFLDQAKVVFFGTVPEMQRSSVPLVRCFLELDRINFRVLQEMRAA